MLPKTACTHYFLSSDDKLKEVVTVLLFDTKIKSETGEVFL